MKREDLFDTTRAACRRSRHAAPNAMNARPSSMARRLVPLAATLAIAAALLLFVFWSRSRTPDLVAAARQRAGLEQVALGLAPSPGVVAAPTEEERASTALAEVPTSNRTVAFPYLG